MKGRKGFEIGGLDADVRVLKIPDGFWRHALLPLVYQRVVSLKF